MVDKQARLVCPLRKMIVVIKPRQVIEAQSHIGVAGTQGPLVDRQRLLIKERGLRTRVLMCLGMILEPEPQLA